MANKKKRRGKKKDKIITFICIFIILVCCFLLLYYYLSEPTKTPSKVKEEKKLTIVNQDSNERPLAIMYDNNVGYDSHAGLQDSYLNYEVIVEGGLTRIMALFKDKDVKLIGPVRSSRHYFLDYSLESDAIYCHYGWSEFAKNDISKLGVDNINGLTNENAYYRDNNISRPHNVFTTSERLYKQAENAHYNTTTKDWKLLNYSVDTISLEDVFKEEVSQENEWYDTANSIVLKYSNYQTTSYQYDNENKYYLRFMDGNPHLDKTTKEQLHYKNIIIEKVKNSTLDGYGRQDLDTIGTGEGYYITNGYATPITWQKDARNGKTVYQYKNGEEIKVNDGNTFIQIVPITVNPEIS